MVIGHDRYSLSGIYNTDIYRMSDVWRYGTRLVNRQENIAEHSYYVIFKVYDLGAKYNVPEDKINKAARIAVCHDCGEIYTGDLPYSLKFYSPEIKEKSEELEIRLIKENFPIFGKDFEDFITNKDPIVTTLVKAADAYSAVLFTTREEQLGNRNNDILQVKLECTERYIKLIEELKQLVENDAKDYIIKNKLDLIGKTPMDFKILSSASSKKFGFYTYKEHILLAEFDKENNALWYMCNKDLTKKDLKPFAKSYNSTNNKLELID